VIAVLAGLRLLTIFTWAVNEVDSLPESCQVEIMSDTLELLTKPEVREADPKVRELQEKAKKNLRVVVRALVQIRRITGVGELENLGKFLGEVSLQETKDAPADPRLLEAIERGAHVRQKLIAAEGGSVSAEEAAKQLGMSKVAILNRYRKGQVLAWEAEKQNAVRFPVWQFKDGRVLPGLKEVLEKLNSTVRLDDFGRLLFFLSNSRFLGGRRPLDFLREGELHIVMQAAEGYGQ
jgi:hypothetical protein